MTVEPGVVSCSLFFLQMIALDQNLDFLQHFGVQLLVEAAVVQCRFLQKCIATWKPCPVRSFA